MASNEPRISHRPRVRTNRVRDRVHRALSRAHSQKPEQGNRGGRRPAITRRAALIGSIAGAVALTDYTDWNDPQAHAQQIAQTGVPLLGFPQLLVKDLTRSIAGGAAFNEGTFLFTQVGYTLTVSANTLSTPTVPFIQVTLTWQDSTGSFVIDTDNFYCPFATGSTAFQTMISGPVKGNKVTIGITNLDPAVNINVNLIVNQDSIPRQRTAARWNNLVNHGLTVTGFPLPGLPSDELVLGVLSNATVAAASNNTWLHAPAPGRTLTLSGTTGGIAASSIVVIVTAVPSSIYGLGAHLLHSALSVGTFSFTFAAPRSPLLVEWANNATTGTLTVNSALVASD